MVKDYGDMAIHRVESIARDTMNRLVIHFDPSAQLWRVTVGLYQAESIGFETACNMLIHQREAYLEKQSM